MKNLEQVIGRLLLFGVIASCLLLAAGGILYLIQHFDVQVNYHTFHPEPLALSDVPLLINEAFQLSATALIKLGIYLLFLVQLLRVGMTAWLFFKIRDFHFVWISLVILFLLLATLVWHL